MNQTPNEAGIEHSFWRFHLREERSRVSTKNIVEPQQRAVNAKENGNCKEASVATVLVQLFSEELLEIFFVVGIWANYESAEASNARRNKSINVLFDCPIMLIYKPQRVQRLFSNDVWALGRTFTGKLPSIRRVWSDYGHSNLEKRNARNTLART